MLSNQDYDDVGFRLTGTMMVALGYLVWSIVRNQDWKYYPISTGRRVPQRAVDDFWDAGVSFGDDDHVEIGVPDLGNGEDRLCRPHDSLIPTPEASAPVARED